MLLVLATALAPSQFGILAVAALTYNVLQAVSQMGVADALTYLQDRIEEASRTALSMLLVAGAILTAGTWALAPAIASFFHSPDATFVLRGFALGIPFDAAAQVSLGRLTRALSFPRRSVTDALPSALGAVVTIVVVAVGHPLAGLVAGQIVGSVTLFVVATLLGPRCRPGWNTMMARQLLSYGGYLSAADLVNFGLLNVDYIIVGHVLGPQPLGIYSLAYRICFMPYLSIPFVANGAVFPYYCRLPTRQALAQTAENAFSVINALSIPWFAGLVLFAGDITVLGEKWAPATGAVQFLAVYALFLSLILTALQVLKAVGRSDLVFASRIVHLAILTGVLLATVHGGITVVAADQAVVAGVIALAACACTVRYGQLRLAAIVRSVGLPALGVLGMIPVALLGRVPWLASLPPLISLLILGPLALAAYAVIVLTVMPEPLRKGWAALRGRSASTPDDVSGLATESIYSIRPGEPQASSEFAAQEAGGRKVDPAVRPASYRVSHLGADKARSYDEDLWDPRAAKGLDWLVEHQLLTGLLDSGQMPAPRAAADFACGTGRVLELLGSYVATPVGIDISPDMLSLARDRCPDATIVLGDVTTAPGLAPGPFDLITAFRFFLNAEPALRSQALGWMRSSLRPGGMLVANFHLNPRSMRGTYLRLRMPAATRPPMVSIGTARQLLEAHGFRVRQVLGYSYLPYRRAGRALRAPLARRAVETRLAGRRPLRPMAGSFLIVASRRPNGTGDSGP
jgi:O-antigen/teichoic acid export membrane protein/SAM-dependent methyltransferase